MIDDPNIVLPLATSYNERGVAGYTHVVTNAEDQRKVNCFYEVARNPMTGKGTLTLSKRPGVTVNSASTVYSAQTSYLIQDYRANPIIADRIALFDKLGNDIRISNITNVNGSPSVITSAVSMGPLYSDVTRVSGGINVVFQIGDGNSQRVYYTTNLTNWTLISDGDFGSLNVTGKMEFMDGFAFVIDMTTNKIFNSSIDTLQAWEPSYFLTKQIKEDGPVGLARLSNKLLAFGLETVEAFYNAGNTVGSPLGRIPQLHTRVGMVLPPAPPNGGTHYYCTIGSEIYFVGRAARVNGCGLYSFNGSEFSKVSPPYIDKILSERSSNIYSVSFINILGRSAVAIALSAPTSSTQISLVYFLDWKEWFEWNSTIFSPVNSGKYHIGIGTNSHKIYSFTGSDNWADDGTNYQFQTQFRIPSNGSTKKAMVMYGLDADTDAGAGGAPPTISVDVSDDNCASFYSLQPINMSWDRKVNFRGGSYTTRWVRLSATDSRPKRIHNFIARVQ